MTHKPYTTYTANHGARRNWRRIVLWSVIGVFVAVVGVGGGYYLWLDAKVSGSNERVPDEVWEVLADDPTTTVPRVTTTVDFSTTTTERPPDPPDAMNLLMLGADRLGSSKKSFGRSDTIILLHVDPQNNYVSMLSIPRDLRVEVEGHGRQKINAAYAYGGPALSIKTVQSLTGLDMDHYLEVDFRAFRDMTDSLGGVYVEVDRRYYYEGTGAEPINLQPGYQLLNGADALDYCRYRHDANMDFGRMERQQRFLSALRQQAMGWDLGLKLPGLISAFFDNAATDLGTNDFLKLAWWGVRLDGSRIRQVVLRSSTSTIDGVSYVIAGDEKIAAAVDELLTVPGSQSMPETIEADSGATATGAPAVSLTGLQVDVLNSTAPAGRAGMVGQWLGSLGATVVTVGNSPERVTVTEIRYPPGLAAGAQQIAGVLGAGVAKEATSLTRLMVVLGSDVVIPVGLTLPATADTIPASAVWKGLAQKVPFPVMAPAYIPDGYSMSKRTKNNATVYEIEVGDSGQPAFVMLYKLAGATQYINITETAWLDAPAACPGREVIHNGMTFTIVGSADKVERIWWKKDGVLYWVSNTLSHRADEAELLAMAESMIPISAQ